MLIYKYMRHSEELKARIEYWSLRTENKAAIDALADYYDLREEFLKQLAWNALSDIAAKTRKTNNIYILLESRTVEENTKSDSGILQTKVVDRIYIFRDLETNGIMAVPSLKLGEFYREEDASGNKVNIVLDPNKYFGSTSYVEERKNFFLALTRAPQEDVVKSYRDISFNDKKRRY